MVLELLISPLSNAGVRRKTVTWDERCDVLEFDCEEGENDPFYSDEDDHGTPDPDHRDQAAAIFGSLPSEVSELVDPPPILPSQSASHAPRW
ncbi:hypothetical protein BDR04DRAFT_1036197 [Suillus decipiens]|nr:hypothetical protein BDR04DRAFT_1036197 [Suillus decipiens]